MLLLINVNSSLNSSVKITSRPNSLCAIRWLSHVPSFCIVETGGQLASFSALMLLIVSSDL